MENSTEDYENLSQENKIFISTGGVIVRAVGNRPMIDLKIECITKAKPYWHVHACCDEFEDIFHRDDYLKYFLLEFADYKLLEEN